MPGMDRSSALGPGRAIEVKGLKANAHLNGQLGTILFWDDNKDRWLVQMDDGSKKMFKISNLQPHNSVNMSEALWNAPAPKQPEAAVWNPATESFQWYEVIKSMIFVKQDPDKDSTTVAIARKGQKLEVISRRVFDREGYWWVELTREQLRRSDCKDREGEPASRAFSLIDASHLGAGVLLRGPLTKDEWPPPEEAITDKLAESPAAPPIAPAMVRPVAPAPTAATAAKWPEQPFSRPPDEAGPQAEETPQVDMTVQAMLDVQTLEVVHTEAAIRMEPSLESPEIMKILCGERIDVEEETFDGWARLVCGAGWVRRCLRTKKYGLINFLRPVVTLPRLACYEVNERPGPREFKVVTQTYVYVRSEPSNSAEVRASKGRGASVWAESQRYDGWVRLQDDEGWMPSLLPHDQGKALHAPLFLDLADWCAKCRSAGKGWAHGNTVSFGDELAAPAEEVLQRVCAGNDPESLYEAIKRARALGVENEELLTQAEFMLEDLRSLFSESGADCGGGDVAPAYPATAAPPKVKAAAEPSDAVPAALEALAVATASGDRAAVRAANAAAKAAGANKKDIARVFALHSDGGAG